MFGFFAVVLVTSTARGRTKSIHIIEIKAGCLSLSQSVGKTISPCGGSNTATYALR